jgi:hypothetical protein
MPCVGCPEPRPPTEQHAVSWKAWVVGGKVYEGDASSWSALPDDGMLAVKVFFSDGLSRVCSGNDWYGLLPCPDGVYTIIHNNDPLAENEKRYPSAIWKRGKWTSDAEMQSVNAAMSEG